MVIAPSAILLLSDLQHRERARARAAGHKWKLYFVQYNDVIDVKDAHAVWGLASVIIGRALIGSDSVRRCAAGAVPGLCRRADAVSRTIWSALFGSRAAVCSPSGSCRSIA